MASATIDYKAVLKELDDIHTAKSRKRHPLWMALMTGDLRKPQVAEFLRHFSAIPLYNHNYHGPLYVSCPSAEWRLRMAEVVYEEGTGRIYADGVPHYELYLRMGEAFGISREEMYSVEMCGGALAIRHFLENICRRSFIEGYAALSLGSEAQVPGVAGRVSEAFKKHYGLSHDEAAFYRVHEEADSDHSGGALEFMQEFVKTENDVKLVTNAVRDCVEASWCMFNDIWRCAEAVR
jgi:pyrroloquinoline quinone (PQQ) biosynthesis protein C